jgi:hypothetical protein
MLGLRNTFSTLCEVLAEVSKKYNPLSLANFCPSSVVTCRLYLLSCFLTQHRGQTYFQ